MDTSAADAPASKRENKREREKRRRHRKAQRKQDAAKAEAVEAEIQAMLEPGKAKSKSKSKQTKNDQSDANTDNNNNSSSKHSKSSKRSSPPQDSHDDVDHQGSDKDKTRSKRKSKGAEDENVVGTASKKQRKKAAVEAAPDQQGESPFEQLLQRLAPGESFEDLAREALEALRRCVQRSFGGSSFVVPFGSLVQGVHLHRSDLDVCIQTPGLSKGSGTSHHHHRPQNPWANNKEQQQREKRQQISTLYAMVAGLGPQFEVLEKRLFPRITVPIVLLRYRSKSGKTLEIDVSAGVACNGVAKGAADRLIRELLLMVPYALPMVRVVKQWAKVLQVSDAFSGYLNPLGWTLLVLQWLVRRGDLPPNWDDVVDLNQISEAPRNKIPAPAGGSSGSYSRTILADFFSFVAKFKRFLPGNDKGRIDDDSGAFISLFDVEGEEEEQGSGDNSPLFLEDPAVRLLSGGSQNVARALRLREWKLTLSRCQEAARQLSREETAMQWARTLTSDVFCPPAAPKTTTTTDLNGEAKKKKKRVEVDRWSSDEEEDEEGGAGFDDEDMRRWHWTAPPDSDLEEDGRPSTSSPSSSSSSVSSALEEAEGYEVSKRRTPQLAKTKLAGGSGRSEPPPTAKAKAKKKMKQGAVDHNSKQDGGRLSHTAERSSQAPTSSKAPTNGEKNGLANGSTPPLTAQNGQGRAASSAPKAPEAAEAAKERPAALALHSHLGALSPSPSPEGASSGSGGAAWKWMR